MRVIKHNGKSQKFNKEKIEVAIIKAADKIDIEMPEYLVKRIAGYVEEEVLKSEKKSITVDAISKLVEDRLMSSSYKNVARSYIEYRHDRDLFKNTTDKSILELIAGSNDEWNKENSNKDAKLVTTQRDYIAGITSKDIARRFIIPTDVQDAMDEGAIYIHDLDYIAENTRTNCCVFNLEDMLQNGTVINGIKINKPHKLLTATTVATQIITAVSSSQYGGVTMSLAHLAPFVNESRKRYKEKYKNFCLDSELVDKLVEADVKKEITDSVQTYNYQLTSMQSTNGQSPFITLWMYLGEAKNKQERDDLALLIEEVLKQRIEGLENEHGAKITIAFPKLVLCLDKYLMDKTSKYYYLKNFAAECTSKRLVPDYVSEKIMKENKINKFGKGDVYGPMGKCKLQLI